MSKIIFNYKGAEIEIQCNIQDKIKDIFKKYADKSGIDISKTYFLYNGNKINDNQNLNEKMSEVDKKRKIMKILVNDNETIIKEKKIEIKEIVCPKCNENILIKINEYKISLVKCKNNHEINNILLNEIENVEKIDLSKIICGVCMKIMSKTFNNEFYRCNFCKINLCPLCKSKHNNKNNINNNNNNNHNIINYNDKNYICEMHNMNFIKYCEYCKLDICMLCFEEHKNKNHSIINFEDIISNEEYIIKEKKKLEEYINNLNNNINDKIKKLNKVKDNLNIYYNLYKNTIDKYILRKINYNLINNIKEFNNYNNNIIIKDINEIINDNNINNQFNKIINIYDKMSIKINLNNTNDYNNKIIHKFEKDPNNLKYKYEITNTNNYDGANDIFEVFLSYKDNKEYIISPNINNYNLDIFALLDNKKIKSLNGHENNIFTVRYFINNKDHHEYLISADQNKKVIIWDITNNYNIKYQINTNYNDNIYSCLLVFPYNNNDNYIVTSTESKSINNDESATKVYSLNNGNFIKYINNTNNNNIYYLLSWYNKNNNKYYIVQLAEEKIIINNLLEDELYSELINKPYDKPDVYHNCGFIYNINNNDYLCTSSINGYINIWDLYNKIIFKVIDTNTNTYNCRLFHIIQWNIKYIIVAEFEKSCFKIINLENELIKDKVYEEDDMGTICIKKIYHPEYGESLLTASLSQKIKLWSIY